jgi:UDP-N-acetylmuramoylalanine--D-glutamate ligase
MGENIELIRELNGVKYLYNHKGDSPGQTASMLDAFNQKVILITTGYDDNDSVDSLGNALVEKVKHLILFGSATAMIEMSLMRKLTGKNQGIDIRITHCSTLKQAVDCAFLSSKADDIVILSAAGPCIDIYSSMEELCDAYRQYTAEL